MDIASPRLDDARRLAWLRLIRSENVGPRTFQNLINYFGGAEAALAALPDMARRGGARKAIRICPSDTAEREIEALARMGGRFVAPGEPGYPAPLAASDGAPPLIAVIGTSAVLDRPMIAIVGARNASAAGRTIAGKLATGLGGAGYVVVSGLARGIDASAHEGALSGGTVAILAGGMDRLYPPENARLRDRILEEGGALATEMPMGWEPRARDFPRRNRIVAGMALGVVVIEAALRSGSLITARMAADFGREVMAVPGSPLDPRCEGTNALIRDGATLVARTDHVLEAVRMIRPPATSEPLTLFDQIALDVKDAPAAPPDDARHRILSLLGPTPAPLDDLVQHADMPARLVQTILLELEIAGRVIRLDNGRFITVAENESLNL